MSCTPPFVTIEGIKISSSDFINATGLSEVSGDQGDPLYDEYEGNIANGNNQPGTTGSMQFTTPPYVPPEGPPVPLQHTPPLQTTLPTPIPYKAATVNDKKPTDKSGAPAGCPIWNGTDYSIYISDNFKLSNFTIGAVFKNQLTDYNATYTKQVRFCNLMNLAINVAEPLRAGLGNLQINSGIRNVNTVKSGLSQHVTGQAMDVQFTGWSYERYWENAQWVKDNIPYDQFIFEHSSKTGLAWYHLSYNAAGNRPASEHSKVMTMYKNHYDSGLKKYG